MNTKNISISVSAILFLLSTITLGAINTVFEDDFETNKGWTVNPFGDDQATTGMWERANPEGTTYQEDVTPGSGYNALVTGPLAGSSYGSYDIDNGKTSIRSPNITIPSCGTITLTFQYYMAHTTNSSSDDYLSVKIVGSSTVTVLEELGAANTDYPDYIAANADISSFTGQTVYILIEAADAAGGSIVEAAVDVVKIEQDDGSCGSPPADNWNRDDATARLHTTDDVGIGLTAADMLDNWPLQIRALSGYSPDNKAIIVTEPTGEKEMQIRAGELWFKHGSDWSSITNTSINFNQSRGYFWDLVAEAIYLDEIKPKSGQDNVNIDATLYTREVVVTLDPFPDYVFAKNYKLKSLEEVENYIKKNKHLPGIPTAEEVKEKGVNLGEVQAKLLEKIEELTLHMISLEKKNKALQEEINGLKKQVGDK